MVGDWGNTLGMNPAFRERGRSILIDGRTPLYAVVVGERCVVDGPTNRLRFCVRQRIDAAMPLSHRR